MNTYTKTKQSAEAIKGFLPFLFRPRFGKCLSSRSSSSVRLADRGALFIRRLFRARRVVWGGSRSLKTRFRFGRSPCKNGRTNDTTRLSVIG